MPHDREKDLLAGRDFSHLTEALSWLAGMGYSHEFALDQNGLTDLDTGKIYPPEQLLFRGQYRFEGASDPSDSSELFAVEAADGALGTLVIAYGAKHSGPAEIIRKIAFSYQ